VLARVAFFASALTLLVASPGAAAAPAARPLTAKYIVLDTTPASQLLGLWRQQQPSRAAAARIAATLPYRTLHGFFRDQFLCGTTEAEVARALMGPDSGACGFGLYPAYRERGELTALVEEIGKRKKDLAGQVARDASRYLPWSSTWKPIRVWFLIASQTTFDAVTLQASADGDSVPVVLINLTEVLAYGATTAERAGVLSHVLAHEVFHAGLREVLDDLPGWAYYKDQPRSSLDRVASVMLDEGVAHYIDWRTRSGSDSLFTWKPGGRETHSFSQLGRAGRRLTQQWTPVESRMEVLQLAAEGPLWSKYGAISGMFAAYRIEMARGLEALREAIAAGPDEFLRLYQEVARSNPALAPVPQEMMRRR
jgi:hypothetical protein